MNLKVNRFSESVDFLIKGGKRPEGSISPDGKTIKRGGEWVPRKKVRAKRSGNVIRANSKNWGKVDSRVMLALGVVEKNVNASVKVTPTPDGNLRITGKYRTVSALADPKSMHLVPRTGEANKRFIKLQRESIRLAIEEANTTAEDHFKQQVLYDVVTDKISVDRIHDTSTFAPVGRVNPRVVLPTKVKTAERLLKEAKENVVIAESYAPKNVEHWKEETRKLQALVRKLEGSAKSKAKPEPTKASQEKRAKEWIAQANSRIAAAKGKHPGEMSAAKQDLRDAQRFQRSITKYWSQTMPKWDAAVKQQLDLMKQKGAKVGDKVKVVVGSHMLYGQQYGTGTIKENKAGQPYISIPASESLVGKSHRWTLDSVHWEKEDK